MFFLFNPYSFAEQSSETEVSASCQNSEIIGGKLITDVCWDCIFPIRVAGISITQGGKAPASSIQSPFCACDDDLGVPMPGVTTSMWEPARLIEFQRTPGCMSVLNGTELPFDKVKRGTYGQSNTNGSSKKTFTHYHYYAFPLLAILNLYVKPFCASDGYMDLDLMYLSEFDPTWDNDELAFFTNPEAAAVANPVATAACVADASMAAVQQPIDELFWCAGQWGNMYPLSGNVSGGTGRIGATSLQKARVLTALHRRGLAHKTMGTDALCGGYISPTIPKSQYKFTVIYPRPETRSGHVMGETPLLWGANRLIPGVGEDLIYMIWRWTDCCNTNAGGTGV